VHTLLLADHSVTIRRVVELTFAKEDVRVVTVSDGEQAIEQLEAAPPDIVLADTAMPGRNGYDVARYVKQSPRLSHIPVLLLAGAFEPVDRVRAEEAGCAGFLAKPFEPRLVISRVQELLARSRSVRAPGDQDIDKTTRVEELDEYFDRLDAAFTNRLHVSTGPVPSSGEAGAAPPADEQGAGLPSLADAFAALLAADREETVPGRRASAGPAADDLVEHVSRRVLAHLSENIVRETVAGVVAEIAERLVREEIERIKAAIEQGRSRAPVTTEDAEDAEV
jgi:CheY-like chemotaxis protein